MESGPPKIIERLIPPACREEVAGDLREESAGWMQTIHALLCVIVSRVRRTADPVVLLMEGLTLYTTFVLTASSLDRPLLFDRAGFLRLAVPSVAMLLMLVLADAYSDPSKTSPLKPMLGVLLGAALTVGAGTLVLPRPVALAGAGFGALLILPIRILFPPPTERLAAKIPAFWQKVELSPLSQFAKQLTAGVLFALLALIVYAVFGLRHR